MDIVDLRISDYMAHNRECSECEYRLDCCGGCRAIALNAFPDDVPVEAETRQLKSCPGMLNGSYGLTSDLSLTIIRERKVTFLEAEVRMAKGTKESIRTAAPDEVHAAPAAAEPFDVQMEYR